METRSSDTQKKRYNKGGQVSRYEPTQVREIMASPFIKKSFEDVGCLGFCERIQEVGCHAKLTSLFATNFKKDKTTIVGIDFTISTDAISIATGIPNHGEIWFKGMDLDIENYKIFLKPHYKNNPTHIFPFRQLLDRYAPLMKMIMKYFTCEGRFSRMYQYHIRLLMHFTAIKPLNLPHYLFRSLVKMIEKVQRKGKDHQTNLFHHGLVKVMILQNLSEINIPWETFIQSVSFLPATSQPSSQSTPSTPPRPQEVGSYMLFRFEIISWMKSVRSCEA
jgi:hypothetical protein